MNNKVVTIILELEKPSLNSLKTLWFRKSYKAIIQTLVAGNYVIIVLFCEISNQQYVKRVMYESNIDKNLKVNGDFKCLICRVVCL